jgi:hypothetical protein
MKPVFVAIESASSELFFIPGFTLRCAELHFTEPGVGSGLETDRNWVGIIKIRFLKEILNILEG